MAASPPNIINQVPYLPTSRNYPPELSQLTVEIDKTNIDTANAVNNRTISLFPTTRPAINGESWFLFGNRRQEGLRQVYNVTSTSSIAHGINFTNIDQFVRGFGSFTDGTNWYGLIYSSSTAIAGQVSFYLTPTNIVFLVGAGAPSVTKGTVTLEWISKP